MFKVYAIRRAIISACRNFLQHKNSTQMCIHDEEGEKKRVSTSETLQYK